MFSKWNKKEIIKFLCCYVAFIVLLLLSQLPGFLSPFYWATYPVVSAFVIAGPLTCVMYMKHGFGSSSILILLWILTYKCIGELGMPLMWIWPLIIAILSEILNVVFMHNQKNRLRICVPFSALCAIGNIAPLYFQKQTFLTAAAVEMSQDYVAGLDQYGTIFICLLVIVLSLVTSSISERITERILKISFKKK